MKVDLEEEPILLFGGICSIFTLKEKTVYYIVSDKVKNVIREDLSGIDCLQQFKKASVPSRDARWDSL
jgi:hypothetical protein